MAIDLSKKKIENATQWREVARALVTFVESGSHADSVYTKSGLSFAAGDFDKSDLAYFDPAQMATAITNVRNLITYLQAQNRMDVFYQLLSGGE
jgi:hypothetical protein